MYLAKNKLDCVEMLISSSIKDGIVDHNEFTAILKQKTDYDCQKSEGDKSKISAIETVLKNKPQGKPLVM